MALKLQHQETIIGVGDKIRVFQRIKESGKERLQTFEGMVIAIKGRNENRSFTVRRIGTQQIGIERIFPLASPTIEKIEVVRKGTAGVKRAKLYYIRDKAKREIEEIYSRAIKKQGATQVMRKKKSSQKRKKSSKK